MIYNDPHRILHAIEQIDNITNIQSDTHVILDKILEKVLQIFESSRAWIFYPCNPNLSSFQVSHEVTTPSFPGAKALNKSVPMTDDMADYCKRALSNVGVPEVDPPPGQMMTNDIALKFNVKSLMFMALKPQNDDAWMFGIHQCVSDHIWSNDEVTLFKIIGQRIAKLIENIILIRQIRASEDKFKGIFQYSNIGIVLGNQKGDVIDANNEFERLIGYSKQELVGMNYSQFTHRDDLYTEKKILEKINDGEKNNYRILKRYISKNKKIRWVDVAVTCRRNSDGAIDMLIAMAMDITERKRAEKAIHDNESYMHSIFRAAPVGIGVVQNRIFSQVNDKFCDMLGYSKDELIGQSARKAYFTDEEYERVGGEKYKQIKQKGTGTLETRLRCKDGEKIDVLLSSTPIEIGNLDAGVTFTALNMTSFKNTQSALKRSEKKYRTMMEAIKDPIYICSDDFIIQYMNQALMDRVGHDATGELCYQALHGFNKICQWCKVEETFQRGHTEKNIISPLDNRSFHVSSTIFENEVGTLSKLSVLRDTTELIELQTRLQEAQKMEAIGNLAGGIAHDFNNILFPILGMSEMMAEDLSSGSMEWEYANEIHKAAYRAKELVSQILTFSRQSDRKKIPVRFQRILKEVLRLCRSTIPANITLAHNIQQDCGSIQGNGTQLHQIAMNLITNAYHAVQKKNGKISVGLEEIKINRLNSGDTPVNPGDYLLFTVTDNGIGMTDNVKEKIFEPYFTTKEQGKGSGLGLAVVYGIVKEYGGEIEVNTEIGSGTTFRIYLPLIGESRRQGIAEAKNTLPMGHEHILLVDDEATVVKIQQQVLERLGYQITSCTSSVDALEIFHSNPDAFDIIITDMTMPNMTGDQLARNVLSIKPDTPIIICTGFSEKMNKEQAEAIGIKGFLMKPVVRSDIAKMVRGVIDNHPK